LTFIAPFSVFRNRDGRIGGEGFFPWLVARSLSAVRRDLVTRLWRGCKKDVNRLESALNAGSRHLSGEKR
jgi:hypothetical protein